MDYDYSYLNGLCAHHPAWRLLRSEHAPLIISFLRRVYIEPNVRVLPASRLTSLLDDELYLIRQQLSEGSFPKEAADYLNDWAGKEWLRKFYISTSDEPHFDLTPATEKAIQWACGLGERTFIGTESRLLTFVELLRQMADGSDPDTGRRLSVLRKQRDEIDEKITRVASGDIDLLSDTELRDRFQQVTQLASGLLADFREVEHNFRQLSRKARERIAMWDGSKGSLLEELWRSRDEIKESDQGRSFDAFCEFLLSMSRQEELSTLLASVLELPAVKGQETGSRMERVHYDWLSAGEATQQTVAYLSQQLRRFLDDQALLENRYIMEILRRIESKALTLRDEPPAGDPVHIEQMACAIELPMERPLYKPQTKPVISTLILEAGQANPDAEALYGQIVVDRVRLTDHIETALLERGPVTLRELTELQPLRHGLAELVAYLDLGTSRFQIEILDFITDSVVWQCDSEINGLVERHAKLPRILFLR